MSLHCERVVNKCAGPCRIDYAEFSQGSYAHHRLPCCSRLSGNDRLERVTERTLSLVLKPEARKPSGERTAHERFGQSTLAADARVNLHEKLNQVCVQEGVLYVHTNLPPHQKGLFCKKPFFRVIQLLTGASQIVTLDPRSGLTAGVGLL